jgi:cobalt/nickel transport system permease protein
MMRMREIRSLGSIIGTLFIRSYERSERVYAAMAARGFDGSHRALTGLTLRKSDLVFGAISVALLVSIMILNLVIPGW